MNSQKILDKGESEMFSHFGKSTTKNIFILQNKDKLVGEVERKYHVKSIFLDDPNDNLNLPRSIRFKRKFCQNDANQEEKSRLNNLFSTFSKNRVYNNNPEKKSSNNILSEINEIKKNPNDHLKDSPSFKSKGRDNNNKIYVFLLEQINIWSPL